MSTRTVVVILCALSQPPWGQARQEARLWRALVAGWESSVASSGFHLVFRRVAGVWEVCDAQHRGLCAGQGSSLQHASGLVTRGFAVYLL